MLRQSINWRCGSPGGERKAFQQQRMGQYEPALATLEKLISDPEVAKDTERTARLSASAARIAHQMGDDRYSIPTARTNHWGRRKLKRHQ